MLFYKNLLIIIETKEGSIFGCYIDRKKYDKNFIFNILTKELIYDKNLEIEFQLYYNSTPKFIVKNHFYLVDQFLYSNNNKCFSNKLKIKEKKFTCRLMEIYEVK